MVHPELLRILRLTLQESKKTKRSVRKESLSLSEARSFRTFNLKVIPIKPPPNQKGLLYLILFEKVTTSKVNAKKSPAVSQKDARTKAKKDPFVLKLQEELKELHEYQQSLTEKFERTQEDLTAANEELQSANEELQSTNEELETAKEELQSGNEELTTVNDELQTRSIEQSQTNNDLINLLGSVEIPIVMLSDDQKVRRFTPLAGKALNLIASDAGRPLSDLKLNFSSPSGEINLGKMVTETIETMVSQEIEVQDHKGHWFRLQVRPYKTIDNKIDGAVLALVDINNLKRSLKEVKAAKKEAEKANRTKDVFLATLSHELRTPLTAILSWAQMLKSGKLNAEKSKSAVDVIVESAKAQAQLINDLLDVSRIVAGKLSLETQEVDPTFIVLAAVEAVRPLAAAKSIQLETLFGHQMGTVMADPNRLKQVFWNLLTNAVKFSAPDSKIVVRVDRVNDSSTGKPMIMIRVEDSGKGIDAEFLPHIFDRFSQEDSSSIRVHGGLGLGLAIVHDLIELHGGTVGVESLGNNQGTTFTVMLPLKSDQMGAAPQTNALKNSVNVGNQSVKLDGVRILVVDDEANARDASCELLSSHGAEVMSAGSAKEGFSIFNHFKPHILVSDIAMAGEDGYSLIKKVRALSHVAGGNTPALAMTAYAGHEDVEKALAAGFQIHLAKPVDGEDFLNSIAKLLGKSLH
jgi:two-component system CheB/CheR fusion protein